MNCPQQKRSIYFMKYWHRSLILNGKTFCVCCLSTNVLTCFRKFLMHLTLYMPHWKKPARYALLPQSKQKKHSGKNSLMSWQNELSVMSCCTVRLILQLSAEQSFTLATELSMAPCAVN